MEIHTLDLGFLGLPHEIASYLVIGPGGPVLVESGPSTTLEQQAQALQRHGFSPADIGHVLLTHIHLDHAGAAGWWGRQGAQIYVHHLGAPHLLDPSRLLASASRIYGDQMAYLWGDVLPVPAERLTPVYDGEQVCVAGLAFTALETPGHARHHHAFRLEDVAFTGDVGGIRLPGARLVAIPTPPPEFDLAAWHESVARLRRENLAAIYPTHFGIVEDVSEHLGALDALLDRATDFIGQRLHAGVERSQLIEEYSNWDWERANAIGVTREQFALYAANNPHFMSVDGLVRYWRKRLELAPAAV